MMKKLKPPSIKRHTLEIVWHSLCIASNLAGKAEEFIWSLEEKVERKIDEIENKELPTLG